jgi:hypothetical protein
MKRILIGVVLCGIGCGAGTNGGTPPPTTHLLDQQSITIPAGQAEAVGPYTVPDGATITYEITDTPTGIGSDSMDVGIATDATAQASNPTLFASQTDVSSVTGTTPDLSAGAYDLYVACHNLSDNCIFDETTTAFY